VWGLPFQTHGVLLPQLSQCLPVLDEICRRSLIFFIHAFIQCIALHGLVHARSCSLFGWYVYYVVYCAERFNCSVNDFIYGRLPIIIISYVIQSTKLHSIAVFLREFIIIRRRARAKANTS